MFNFTVEGNKGNGKGRVEFSSFQFCSFFILMIIVNARKVARTMTINYMKFSASEKIIRYVHIDFYGKIFKTSLSVTLKWISHSV